MTIKVEDLTTRPPDEELPHVLDIEFTAEERAMIDTAAACQGITPEQFMLNAAVVQSSVSVAQIEAERERRARVMGVHPSRLEPHEGPGECAICGVDPGEEHHLATHDAEAG